MKKLSILALAAIFAVGASAQDTFKQVKKTKDYAEASQLVKANEANMQPEEAAQCYNYLTKINRDKAANEIGTINDNQIQAQMGGKIKPVDTLGLYKAIYTAIIDANACDKYDQQPNAKGKVPNKFRKDNATNLYPWRARLIDAGIHYQTVNDNENFYNYLSLYVDTDKWPLFSEQDRSKDENLTNIAYFAAIGAFQLQKYDEAIKYASIAENDPQYSKEATNIKINAASQGLKTRADSIQYADKLKAMLNERPDDENVFSQLANLYQLLGMADEATQLIDARIAKNPDYSALVMRGDKYYNEKNWQKALEDFKAAAALPDANTKNNIIPVIAYVGNCYAQIADAEVDANSDNTGNIPAAKVAEIKKIYEQAIEWYQKAKSMDTKAEHTRFYAYPLYNCCYRAYGENDPRTQAAQP